MTYALNVSSVDKCRACDDTGWVELADGRGSAPCKWCEQGKSRYARMIDLRQHPASNFDLADVVMPNLDSHPFKPPAPFSKTFLKAIPSETRRDVERRRKVEQDRLATVELPVEPAPTQPDYSDIPF